VKRLLIITSFAIVASLGALSACKQGQGDRCQVNDDCESPLVCNKAKNTCENGTGGDQDAGIIDAIPQSDAGVDAPQDAPRDAMPDA